MYFIDLINKKYKDKKIDIYVDMDGVICDYDVGNIDYLNKRPLKNTIKLFENLSHNSNITLHILSIGKKKIDIKNKNTWLDKNAPFFLKENRHILTKETYQNLSSKEIKCKFLREQTHENIILIDDDNGILKYIKKELPNVILYQDSSLID